MSTKKTRLNKDGMNRVIAEARRNRRQDYREQALKIFPWICARCGREFTGKRLRELTVHHKDHNHNNNPPDGSNWELLCLYCHDNEHSRYLDQEWYDKATSGDEQEPPSKELEVAASAGLSAEYLNKGPISALHSIADSLEDGPMAVYDVGDDPRIQYPGAAEKEGIASILSVPIMVGDEAIGAMRAYTAEKWEFTLDDVNFVQALAQISGILIEMNRLHQGQSEYIDTLSTLRESPEL